MTISTSCSSSVLEGQLRKFLEDHKAKDVVTVDLRGKSVFADAMLIATGSSGTFIRALADKIKEFFHKNGCRDIHVEGDGSSDWVLIDGGDIIIHLFKPEMRELYNLEKMWNAEFSNQDLRVV